MARNINLSEIDTEFILERARALELMFGKRNRRMDQYEKMYRLDVWPTVRGENETRVTLPTAFDAVEKMRALLITRPPTISVPYSSASPKDQERAQNLEKYLYGAAHRMSFRRLLADAEWFAECLGRGWLKLVYDGEAIDDDYPLVLSAPDPRHVYYLISPHKNRCTELVHKWQRSRREIEDEWGYEFPRPIADFDALNQWLDEKINYIEYWREITAWEKVEPKAPEPRLMTDIVTEKLMEQMKQALGQTEAGYGGDDDADEAPAEEPKKRRVRKIVHAVMCEDTGIDASVGGTLIKKAVVVPGYKQIPFYGWAGTATPMPGENADLSILFPLSNGDGGDGAMGVLAALTLLASIDLQVALDSPNAPIVSDDPDATIDLSPKAINYVRPGSKVDRLAPDSTNPAVGRSTELLGRTVDRVAIPEVLGGQYLNLSGAAISGLSSAFQMLVGFRQQDREQQLESLLSGVLCLTKYYGDETDGWSAWGENARGKYVDQVIKPSDIGDNYRVTVKLSASMPKDSMGMLSALSMLLSKDQISMETFLDLIQKLPDIGLASDSPNDEITRILRNKILLQGSIAESTAAALSMEYVELILSRSGLAPEAVQAVRSLLYKQLPQQGEQQQQQLPGQGAPTPPGGMPQMPPQSPQMPGGGGAPPIPMPATGPGDIPPEAAAFLAGNGEMQ